MTNSSSTDIPAQRIAALDLGTNSFHVVIVDIYPDGSFRTVDKLKEMVVLAEKGMRHHLSKAAMDRGISALKKIKILCEHQGAERLLAYATSAIREAVNGGEFIQRMIDEVGIKAHAISGNKEAKLIGQAVKHAITFDDETVLTVDIGGGSVEFILGTRDKVYYSASKKLGVARMAAQFVSNDPITEEEIKQLRDHFSNELKDLLLAVKEHPVKTIVGSSGTMENIAGMIADQQAISSSVTLNELTYSTKDYVSFHDKFITKDRAERFSQNGLEEKRVDIILPGLVLLEWLITKLDIERVKISEWALREGMILDYIQKEKESLDLGLQALKSIGAGPRRRSVFELLRKCDWHEKHSRHVANMALQLFDALQNDLDLAAEDRDLLEFAAYMHDIGYHISHRKHHKHALYIIRHADLKGFSDDEINMMANIARYHRRSIPQKRHKRYRKMEKPLQERIKKLSALLRVADGLDRSHFQNVQQLEIQQADKQITLLITTEAEPELEIWGAKRKSHLFEQVTRKKLKIYPRREGKVVEVDQPDPFPEHKS